MIGGAIGPDNPQIMQWDILANIEMFGPFASRPHDRAGIAAFYNGVSDNYEDLVGRVGVDVTDVWGFEVCYNFEITPAIHITPDFQIVQNALDDDDPAAILGVRCVMDF